MQKLTTRIPIPRPRPPLLPPLALRKVISKSGKGVYASSDTLFKGAIFGRDSLEVAEDLIEVRPKLVRRVILTLAALQGEIDNPQNEEEPGKIVHEYRTSIVDGKPIDDVSRHILEELSQRWGGEEGTLTYYGSIDATPLFVRLVGRYCQLYGTSILQERITLRSGHRLSLMIVIENAMEWLTRKLDDSTSGLLEYARRNPQGIENQAWKDSVEFYVHENGEIANHQAPISSIEVQGIAYDALLAAATLLPDKAAQYKAAARTLRDGTIWLLWQPQYNYFALGTDLSPAGGLRIIDIQTANPAELLDTHFFDDLPEPHRQEYIGGIVRKIMSKEFLTDAGIRSRGLSAAHVIPFWDYHGSYTSWPKESYDIVKGLRRQGFPILAKELENRLLNIVLKCWEYPEFVYVDEWGRVMSVSPSSQSHGEMTFIDSSNAPERVQAWTVSAIVAIIAHRLNAKFKSIRPAARANWQIELEKRVLSNIPRIKRMINPIALNARYPTYSYRLVSQKSKQPLKTPAKNTVQV